MVTRETQREFSLKEDRESERVDSESEGPGSSDIDATSSVCECVE